MKDCCEYIIGIDGGGTKTELISADSHGSIIESRIAGSTNHQSTDYVYENFIQLLSPYQGKKLLALVAFLSGWDFEKDQAILKKKLDLALTDLEITIKHIFIENDIFAVLKSGLAGEKEGVCLISGTGILCAAVNGSKIQRTFGFGYSSGEWGSGIDIGREALYQVFASYQKREPPCPVLTTAILNHFRAADCEQLARKVNDPDFSIAETGLLIPQLITAMNLGSAAAETILKKGGREQAKTAAAQLNWLGRKAPLVLGGGVFKNNGILPGFTEELKEKLKRDAQEIRILQSPPAMGSLLWSAELAGVPTKEIISQIRYKKDFI